MAYSFQTFAVLEVLTATKMNQVEVNIRDHQHGSSNVIATGQAFTSPNITTSLTTGSTTFALVNTTATTVNFAGAAITLNIGAATCTTNLGGSLVLGTATTLGTPVLDVSTSVGTSSAATFKRANGADTPAVVNVWSACDAGTFNYLISFGTEASYTERGTIDYNRGGGVVRYNTTSDKTLKTLIGDAPVETSVGILKSTRLREFFWNDDPTKKPQIGPFAQELYETFKGAVSVGGEHKDGRYRPWGVDKTAFAFHLVAGWQNHESRLAELERKMQ